MKIDIQQIDSGEDEIIVRYREKTPRIQKILELLKSDDSRLFGKKDGETVCVIPGNILYIESVDDKCFAYTIKDVYRLDGSLQSILQDLGDDRFFRCSKSMIINVGRVTALKSLSSNRIDATMEGGEHIIISRRYASDFRRLLKGDR